MTSSKTLKSVFPRNDWKTLESLRCLRLLCCYHAGSYRDATLLVMTFISIQVNNYCMPQWTS